jgi:hypothetical protein
VTRRNLPLDLDGAKLDFVLTDTPNGPRVFELKITCPTNHPTGVTTAMLRAISATDLDRAPTKNRRTQLERYLASVPSAKWVPNQRGSLDDQQLKLLADIYQHALKLGVPPTKTIEEWLGCSRPTASRAIKQARDLGMLDAPSRRGLPAKSRMKPNR